MDFKDLLQVLKSAKHVLIAAHQNPDGDAIGSTVGFAHFCEAFQLPYTILMESIPEKFRYLTDTVVVKTSFKEPYDVFVSLDCGEVGRLGTDTSYFKNASITVNIDHHITNQQFATYNYVDSAGSSTSELVYDLAKTYKMPLTVAFAKAIYTGLLTDTGGFMHSCTKPSTHEAAAELIRLPFDASTLYHKLIHEKSFKTLEMEGLAIKNLQRIAEDQVFISYFTPEQLEAYGATKEDIDGIVSFIKNIEGVEIAVLIYPGRESGTYKISFRCNDPYDVAAIASRWGGGGHTKAAGATITGNIEQVLETISEVLLQVVHK